MKISELLENIILNEFSNLMYQFPNNPTVQKLLKKMHEVYRIPANSEIKREPDKSFFGDTSTNKNGLSTIGELYNLEKGWIFEPLPIIGGTQGFGCYYIVKKTGEIKAIGTNWKGHAIDMFGQCLDRFTIFADKSLLTTAEDTKKSQEEYANDICDYMHKHGLINKLTAHLFIEIKRKLKNPSVVNLFKDIHAGYLSNDSAISLYITSKLPNTWHRILRTYCPSLAEDAGMDPTFLIPNILHKVVMKHHKDLTVDHKATPAILQLIMNDTVTDLLSIARKLADTMPNGFEYQRFEDNENN
jgi:hypothetical protein